MPLLSAAAPFKSGGRGGPDYYTDVKAGAIAIKDVADIYLYPNTMRVVKIDGATLREWLERSAGIFRRIDPTTTVEQPLIDPAFASYNFDVIDGVTYAIDVTQPSRYDVDGAACRAAGASHPRSQLRGQADRRGGRRSRRHQQLPRERRRQFPGLRRIDDRLEAPDANREALVRYIVGDQARRAKSRRQLAVCALAGERRRDFRDLARSGLRGGADRRQADADGRRARRLRQIPSRVGVREM